MKEFLIVESHSRRQVDDILRRRFTALCSTLRISVLALSVIRWPVEVSSTAVRVLATVLSNPDMCLRRK